VDRLLKNHKGYCKPENILVANGNTDLCNTCKDNFFTNCHGLATGSPPVLSAELVCRASEVSVDLTGDCLKENHCQITKSQMIL